MAATKLQDEYPERRWWGPARYNLARLCLVPLALLSGVCLVLSLAAVPLTANSPPAVAAVEALSMAFYVLLTVWITLQAATISHDPLVIHEVRIWAYAWPAFFLVHLIQYVAWALMTQPLNRCPPMPACETTLGGICSASDLQIYSQLLVCEVNWGLFAAGLGVLVLEVAILVLLLVMRILPALEAPHRGGWRMSVYKDHNVHWRFQPWTTRPTLPSIPALPAIPTASSFLGILRFSACLGRRPSDKGEGIEIELTGVGGKELWVSHYEEARGQAETPPPTADTVESFGSTVPLAPSKGKDNGKRKGEGKWAVRDPLSIFL